MMKTISASRAKWVLRKYLTSRIFWSRKILLFDQEYLLVDEAKLNLMPVQLDGGDCDEKAFIMFADVIKQQSNIMFGFCEGYNSRRLKHAWVFFISQKENQVKFVEPVTAEIFLPTNEKVYHFIR